jgi:DNA-binding beta-propeller fold protein YncE
MKCKWLNFPGFPVMFSLLILLSCGGERATSPKSTDAEGILNFRLYILDPSNNILLSLDCPTDTMVDSVSLSYAADGVSFSPATNQLLVNNYNSNTTELYDASGLSHIGSLDGTGEYYFDAGDNYALKVSYADAKVYFIDPLNYQEIDSISITTYAGFLDTVGNTFWFDNPKDIGKIYKIDCTTRKLADSMIMWDQDSIQIITVWEFAFNWVTRDLYFHGSRFKYDSKFFQYSTEQKKIIKTTNTQQPYGDVAVSSDGKFVYMSEDYDLMHGISRPNGYIWVFDALTHRIRSIIESADSLDPIPLIHRLIPSPDGERLYVSSTLSSAYSRPIMVADLKENKIVNIITPYPNFFGYNIATGPTTY